jgi:outer membrane protein TolC
MSKICSLFIGLVCFTTSFAQLNDSMVLPINTFIDKVKLHHPLAKVAAIEIDKANANLLTARGGFDPVLELEARQKNFDGKNYYSYQNAELKQPLPIGEVKTGMEKNKGLFLSDEVTRGRSSYLGVEVPLAKGLLIDKRRAFLQQAKIAVSQSKEIQRTLVNDLLLEAYETYYQWAGNYRLYNIFSGYVQVSNDRLRLVKTLQANGDRAVMDTIEAFTQLQNFLLMQADAKVKLNSAKFMLDNFIWDATGNPQLLSENILPDTSLLSIEPNNAALIDLVQNSAVQNPLLNQYRFKIDILDVERRLKFQNLLPTLNLKGNILSKDYYAFKNNGLPYLDNNNYFGITFKMPLLFREGRGEYRAAKLKVAESKLELQQKVLETQNKVRDYYNQFLNIESQIGIAKSAYNNYYQLLRNELLRFNNGESSLFLVNTRENKVLEMQQKIIELQVKLLKAKYGLDWSAGVIK